MLPFKRGKAQQQKEGLEDTTFLEFHSSSLFCVFSMAVMGKCFLVLMVVVVVSVLGGCGLAEAGQHHVVGGDRGWDLGSDIGVWSLDKVFRVGDNIWFAYSAAEEAVVELTSKEDFEACNVTNPIRMFTDGLSRVALEGKGERYFASAKPISCSRGLKLRVEVLPASQGETVNVDRVEAAQGPAPSGSIGLVGPPVMALLGLALVLLFSNF
ncbi:hypothetical protein QJS04_geneDACA005210 [Acorus gramineus]|uniref:Phytocyanin domain-containing protein n=1 Tax=Acorus gramineus TaxID=55184 RepID=A0AAV9AW34_ACOGR|nr:hypothetical protein QJS04_geneDACA005210 [Acorus gramineus]